MGASSAGPTSCSGALLGLTSVAVEPRFTCVTAWVPTRTAAAAAASVGVAVVQEDAPLENAGGAVKSRGENSKSAKRSDEEPKQSKGKAKAAASSGAEGAGKRTKADAAPVEAADKSEGKSKKHRKA